MLEVSASFLWIDAAGRETLLDYDGPQRSDPAAHVRPMACADGWMYIVALSDDQYTGLCRALEVEVDERLATMAGRHQNRGLARHVWREIRARLAALGVAEAGARLEAHDVPHSPAVAVPDLPGHPQLSRREFFSDSVHPRRDGCARRGPRPVLGHAGGMAAAAPNPAAIPTRSSPGWAAPTPARCAPRE